MTQLMPNEHSRTARNPQPAEGAGTMISNDKSGDRERLG
jgi:hypothetical protein